MSTPKSIYITEQEYRDSEEMALGKHEWLDGKIYPMPICSYNHTTISGNISFATTMALKGSPCTSRHSGQRIKIESTSLETYPDTVIFCPPWRFTGEGDSTLLTPKVIFEVLSEETETYDHTNKFWLYKTIPTFEEYVLVEQSRIWVDHYRRVDNGWWLHKSYSSRAEILRLESVGIQISLNEIYEELELPEELLSIEPPLTL